MKKALVCLIIATSSIFLSGCVGYGITAAQAEGKLPGADVESASVEIATAYGTSYTLNVKDVKHNEDGSKTYGEYNSRYTSPAGSAKVEAKGVRVTPAKAK